MSVRTYLFGKISSAILAALSLTGFVVAAEPATGTTRQLVVSPEVVTLDSSRDSQAITAIVRDEDGATTDVSTTVELRPDQPGLIQAREGLIEPVADGETRVVVAHGDLTTTMTVRIKNATAPAPVTFRNDVLAVLTRTGCNSGKCHGAASGKDGFRLSLFGYDPLGDYHRITRELGGRRINLAAPADCLLMNKALGNVPHTGGARIESGSRNERILLDWLEAGAPADPADMPLPVGIEVFPKDLIFGQEGSQQLLMVMAHYSDGSDRDVTDFAVFMSNNDAVATVTEDGVATATGPGSAFITARFDEFSQGTSLIVRPKTAIPFPDISPSNGIDELTFAHWKNLRLIPSEPASDDEFLRRATIDLIGLMPTVEERRTFVASTDPAKREKLIDELLNRPEFLDLWVMRWAELLQMRSANGLSSKALRLYDQWLRERIRSGATVADVLKELIPATGSTFENPATNYYQTETTPQLLAENVAQAFLGMRIQCAQCHNHPFDRWTMNDYYGFAAFFSQVGYKQAADPRELVIFNLASGEMTHPVTKQSVPPKFLGGDIPELAESADSREPLSVWLTERENKAFSRNIANLVWSHFFGIGIVEPVDDVRVSNPPSNPRLLDHIADRVAGSNFDIRPLVREICLSRTYQLSSKLRPENRWDNRHFSHARIRRLRAEVLLDCINQVTEANQEWQGLPPGSRAVHIIDGTTPNYFLSTFGRSDRSTPCSCEVSTAPTLSQSLHLLNGETTSGKIQEGGVVKRLVASGQKPEAIAAELYERCLCRTPTEREQAAIAQRLRGEADVETALTDLFWAILNSNEFLFNH